MTPEQDALQHAEQLYLTALDYQAWQSMEIDELRQKLADKDAEIERLTGERDREYALADHQAEGVHKFATERDDYRTKSERLEAECAAMLARLQAAEKRRGELIEQNNTLLERFTGAIKAMEESSALRSQLAEQERDMRQMVEALKYALPWAISGGASKERESAVIATRAALALPSAQRLMKKGD